MSECFVQYDVQPYFREIRCPDCTGAVESWPPNTVYPTVPPRYPYRCKSCGHEFTSTYQNKILYRLIPGTEKIVTIGDESKVTDKDDTTVM